MLLMQHGVKVAIRSWHIWMPQTVLGSTIATIEYVVGREQVGRVLADAWMITVVGAIAADTGDRTVLGNKMRRILLTSIVPALLFAARSTWGRDVRHWDWLYLSGVALFLVGAEMADQTGERLNSALRGLADGGVLPISDGRMRPMKVALQDTASRYQYIAGISVGLSVLVGWLFYTAGQLSYTLIHNPAAIVFESLAGVIAGRRLGRMVAYSSVWTRLEQESVAFVLLPGHPDDALGLKPVGQFFFWQSIVAGLPALYLAIWWFLIPILPPSYLQWRPVFLGLLALAIVFEMLVFLLPMRSIHQMLVLRRQGWRSEADGLIPRIGRIQAALLAATSGHDDLSKQLDVVLNWYRTLRRTPAWPVDPSLRRWFSFNNLALLAPFLSYLAGDPAFWQQVANVLTGLKH